MTDVLAIIETALARKGLSAAAASRLAVGNPSLIKNMRLQTANAKRFNADALQKLAHVLDLEFYFGELRESTTVTMPGGFAERTVAPLSQAPGRQEALELGFLPIPYHPAAAPQFRGTAPVALSRQWLEASGLKEEHLAFLPVLSDEMAPTLTIGALALIDFLAQAPHGEAVWAVSVAGRCQFARLQQPSADMLVLKGDRADKPVQVIKGVELATTKVLGKVVWIAQRP